MGPDATGTAGPALKEWMPLHEDPDGPFCRPCDREDPNVCHLADLAAFTLRSHGTGLWKLNQNEGKLDFVMELPGCGDTAFASWVRLSEHKFLVANYTSPISRCEDWSWLQGQISPLGTGIYFVVLDFTPK